MGRKKAVKKMGANIVMLVVGMLASSVLSCAFDQFFTNDFQVSNVRLNFFGSLKGLAASPNQLKIFLILVGAWIIFLWVSVTNFKSVQKAEMMTVTNKIKIPKPAGQGQFGTARFMTEDEKEVAFYTVTYDGKSMKDIQGKNLGIVVGMEKGWRKEIIRCVIEDAHAIIIGSTRSRKTRTVIIESIWLRSFARKSMIITDVKGELWLYCSDFLRKQGVEPVALDLRQPKKSKHHNYMININKAIDAGDIPQAIDYTWDLVSVLVGIPKGEPLWNNGESAVIAASILAIALEAPKEYRNLTNAYYFIAFMCKANEYEKMPITEYFSKLPDTHPAKGVFAVAEISPERTRGSFFGSALATLRHFTNWNIAEITSDSEFDISEIGKRPMALFIIVPDEKTTLYSLVSLLINQTYVAAVEVANQNGGRLPVEIDYYLDEFGNTPVIPSFGSMMSAGAGRGIRFIMVLQDYQQLEKHYKEDHKNIKGNTQYTVYLRTPTPETQKELSDRLDKYTCLVNSSNSSVSGTSMAGQVSFSGGASLQGRSLLTPGEIGMIDRPYSLVLKAGDYPAIVKAPDLSKYYANEELGLGDEEHDRKVRMQREQEREERSIGEMKLWGIWNQEKEDESSLSNEEPISFIYE